MLIRKNVVEKIASHSNKIKSNVNIRVLTMAENIRQFDVSENQLNNDNKQASNLPCENNNVDCLSTDVILDSINVDENIEIQEEIVLTHAVEEVKFQQAAETKQGDKCEENHVVIVDTSRNDESNELIERNHIDDPVKGLPKGTVLTKMRNMFAHFHLLFRDTFLFSHSFSCVYVYFVGRTMAGKTKHNIYGSFNNLLKKR